MGIIESILTAASLCADCFAVTLCSGVTLKKIEWKEVLPLAFAFAVIQTLLLLLGWLFGSVFVGLIYKISHVVGFLLLLYVGGSMLVEGIRKDSEALSLNGFRNVVLGGIATSIDAFAVGVAGAMAGEDWKGFFPLLVSVFVITAISVVCGLFGGRKLGEKFGHAAEIAGGLCLIGIGISLLFRI